VTVDKIGSNSNKGI